jgi:hypothetical protein
MTTDPSPYDTHTSATDPEGFAYGWATARHWLRAHSEPEHLRVHDLIAASDGRPWPQTAAQLGWPADAYHEARALYVYAAVRLARLEGTPCPSEHPSSTPHPPASLT